MGSDSIPITSNDNRKDCANNNHKLNEAKLKMPSLVTAVSLNTETRKDTLTSFSDYTAPPESDDITTEHDRISRGEQSGLSSIYNRLLASVINSKVLENGLERSRTAEAVEPSSSKPGSGRNSRLQSPQLGPSDPIGLKTDQRTAVSRIKSPKLEPRIRLLLDPAITQVNALGAHALQNRIEAISPDPGNSADIEALSRLSHDEDVRSLDQLLPSLDGTVGSLSTETSSKGLHITKAPSGRHERTISSVLSADHSAPTQPSPLIPDNRSTHSYPLSRVTSPVESTKKTDLSRVAGQLSFGESDHHKSTSTAQGNGTSVPMIAKVSHSRLPGFTASRASSIDSTIISAPSIGSAQIAGHDGQVERSRPSKSTSSRRERHLLDKDFWMKDENAKYCFNCSGVFSTFRRKHHCRTCGQIFDSKCTTIISGQYFGKPGTIRVCIPCEQIVTSHIEDSSDFSETESVSQNITHPSLNLDFSARYDDDNISIMDQNIEDVARTPMMNYPVRRAIERDHNGSTIFEFASHEHALHRPSSSRSLRTSHLVGHGHRRMPSRLQHVRHSKLYHPDRAPFQKQILDEVNHDSSVKLNDGIIDPEMAKYLSDDPSSDEEVVPLVQEPSTSIPETDRNTLGSILAAVRKNRPTFADKSIAALLNLNRDNDDAMSVTSAAAGDAHSLRRRNSSTNSASGAFSNSRDKLPTLSTDPHENRQSPLQRSQSRGRRLWRSASMHGVAAPVIELNKASLQHVHKMLAQLLTDAGVVDVARWQKALVPILLKATDEVDPDVQAGDDMDVRSYVKLKKIPGGQPRDTAYVSGLVFSKSVALKSMSRFIANPRILILTFPLEYVRPDSHFTSLDPVIRQETEYLENMVRRIASVEPDVLLCQRGISGKALEMLSKHNIAAVFNVKPSVLDAVSRCTMAPIISTLERLTLRTNQLGTCGSFEVKTYIADGQRRSYLFFSGCDPRLGCTIAIRGANRAVLHKIKKLTEFMVYVVYNLKLETCLMRDEMAMLPCSDTVSTVQPLDNADPSDEDANEGLMELKIPRRPEIPQADLKDESEIHPSETKESDTSEAVHLVPSASGDIPDSVPVPTFYQDLADKHQTRILSASPFVQFAQPYLLQRARELERRVAYLRMLRDQDLTYEAVECKPTKFVLIQPEMIHNVLRTASQKVREIVHAVHDSEYEKALFNYEVQKKSWEAHISGNKNLFDPVAHQNIVVLFSVVSTVTHVPCEGPDAFALQFYGEDEDDHKFEADCTLGQYVEDLIFRANQICEAEACGRHMHDHHRHYVHGEGQVTVFVQPHPPKMKGMHNIILMWSVCKICGVETPVCPMSQSTWKYSFGKYLELSFWSTELRTRSGGCKHDLHRDHLRYFGYNNFALRIHYDKIDLMEVITPRTRVTWKVNNDLKFRNNVYTKLEQRIVKFMASVKLRLKSINTDALPVDTAEACKEEITILNAKANEDHASLIKQLQDQYTSSQHWEIIPLNKALRALTEKVADWDNIFADFEHDFFPSEKDIRRLATIQLKRIFLDSDVSITVPALDESKDPSPVDASVVHASPTTDEADEHDHQGSNNVTDPEKQTQLDNERDHKQVLSPEKTQNLLEAVLEENIDHTSENENKHGHDLSDIVRRGSSVSARNLEHLDLAIPSAGLPMGESSAVATESLQHEGNSPSTTESTILRSAIATSQMHSADPSHLSPTQPNLVIPSKNTSQSRPASPVLVRAQSQPAGSLLLRKDIPPTAKHGTLSTIQALNGFGFGSEARTGDSNMESTRVSVTEKLGNSIARATKIGKTASMIPRAVVSGKNSRVSNLAKHFEQLSREFEKERIKEKRLQAARNRYSRMYPSAAPKAVVEVFQNANETNDELDDVDPRIEEVIDAHGGPTKTTEAMADTATNGSGYHDEDMPDTIALAEREANQSMSADVIKARDEVSELETDLDSEAPRLPDDPADLLRMAQEDIELKDLPKEERVSLMKMLTKFWAERSSSGWSPLDYPTTPSDHVFTDCDIVVREDELSSIVAFACDSKDYKTRLNALQSRALLEEALDGFEQVTDIDDKLKLGSLLRPQTAHLKYQFQQGSARMLCKIYFAEQFDAMRKICGVADRYIESMSRCMKFDSKGGKSKSLFLKTLDDRFVIKSLSQPEIQSFLKFAPNYFQLMAQTFFHDMPSAIAKMLGFYQIIVRNPATGVEHNWNLIVMENLFYDRTPTRIFDLKGSMRNRKINATGEQNEVLLDENMVDFIYESPIFAREHSKRLLRDSVFNDTLFLARQNVMDYSLMIAIDDSPTPSHTHFTSQRKELVVGIIDCIRTFTWDKKLESWIKAGSIMNSLMAGGGLATSGNKNRPTVTSPKEYKKRFREAMSRYVLESPDCWHQFRVPRPRVVVREGQGPNGNKQDVLI